MALRKPRGLDEDRSVGEMQSEHALPEPRDPAIVRSAAAGRGGSRTEARRGVAAIES